MALVVMNTKSFAGETTDTIAQQLDKIVQQGIAKKVYPGAVLIVGRPGQTLHKQVYGTYTYDAGAKQMSFGTLFDLASVSKIVGTSTAAMKLLELHKIRLDDKVSNYIPAFASGGKQDARIHDLLTHMSGLKAYTSTSAAEIDTHPQ